MCPRYSRSSPMNKLVRSLSVKDLCVMTHLGCSEEERRNPQKVLVSFEFSVEGLKGDELKTEYDYARLSLLVADTIGIRHFHSLVICSGLSFIFIKRVQV